MKQPQGKYENVTFLQLHTATIKPALHNFFSVNAFSSGGADRADVALVSSKMGACFLQEYFFACQCSINITHRQCTL